jgi:hypothetical protein
VQFGTRRKEKLSMDDFGLWDVLVSMFWFTLLMTWVWMIIAILADIFRDPDLNGAAKAMWTAFIVLLPWLGAISYIFSRGNSMNERALQARSAQDAQMRALVHESVGTTASSISAELRDLAQLRDDGVLSVAEYEQAKGKVLA